ncbi:hypothetical protein PG988_005950 [Apiospora saccharicola]
MAATIRTAREVLDLTVLIIVGGEVWHGLKRWLFEKTERSGHDTPKAYAQRVRVRCHLFTAISSALQRWDPDDSSGRTRKFSATSVRLARDHIDLLPLIIEGLEDASSRPSRSRDDFKNLLVVAKREAFRFEAELELLGAELCLNHPVGASPWEFRKLLNRICADRYHPLRVEPPTSGAQPPMEHDAPVGREMRPAARERGVSRLCSAGPAGRERIIRRELSRLQPLGPWLG